MSSKTSSNTNSSFSFLEEIATLILLASRDFFITVVTDIFVMFLQLVKCESSLS